MNEIIEKIKNVVEMYRKQQISEYVLERELASFMGDKAHVVISKDNKNIVTKSFAVFLFPQMMSDGFHITYIIDEHAVKDFYNAEEFAVVMNRLRGKTQKYLLKFNEFIKDTKEQTVSYSFALGFFLDLYAMYMHELRINETSDNFLPDAAELKGYADKFNTETSERSDLESLVLKGYLCDEITEFVKKYIHESKNDNISIKLVDKNAFETPQFNLGQQELLKFATSSFGVRDHKELPHDYKAPR